MIAMVTGCPRARQDLVLQEVGREGLLYDREGELIHILNTTAMAIWRVCDGERDIDAIETVIRGRFSGVESQDIRGDIEKLLTQFDERGLLEGEGARPAAPRQRTEAGPQRRA